MTPVNDPTNEGVDWTVVCGGSPVTGSTTGGACGTFSPAHTADGSPSMFTAPSAIPIGTTVTITATVTSDPAATSSVTLPIVTASIGISFIETPATSVVAGATIAFAVQIANDTTAAGATWTATCGSTAAGACGSFNPALTASETGTTYTAPSAVPPGGSGGAGTVTITATSIADPADSVSAVVTILPPPSAITLSVAPTSLTVGERSTANLVATVANDASNAGVDWSVSCASPLDNCGTFTPSAGSGTGHTASGAAVTYKAPTSSSGVNPVVITATAKATEGTSSVQSAAVSTTIDSTPTIYVTVTAPASVDEQASTTLTATVTNDSTDAGVTWTVSCNTPGECGALSNEAGSGESYTATYIAPASTPPGGIVTVSATPKATAAGNPGLASITIVANLAVSFLEEPPSTLVANGQAPVNATVSDDLSPGGVTWTVQCSSTVDGGCGYVQPYRTVDGVAATYTAPPTPPSGTVTIVATSTADSSVSANSTPVTITASTALSIGFVPLPPTQVEVGASMQLNAAVANDATKAGVDWSVSCADGCGFFTVVPEIPAVPATETTPYVPEVPAVTATSVTAWPNGLPILYTAPATPPSGGGTVVIVAAPHVNNSISTSSSVTVTESTTGPQLQGVVQAGTTPVVGAQVALYATSASGYGSASSLVYAPGSSAYATTGSSGGFTLPAGYSCPSSTSQMYLVATGGQVGTSPANPNLALMTALGPCDALSSSTVVINEVTTVASAYAAAPFAANPLTTGLNSYLNIGSSSTNTTGLANAFATVNNLASIATGKALFTVPPGNASVPYAEINTLADILDACAVTGGGEAGDGSACGNLFVDANPYATQTEELYSGVPTDTLQAVFEIAQNPSFTGISVTSIAGGDLYGMASQASPFQPILNAAPDDFSISLNFTSGGGLSSTSGANYFALDSSGNLWITNTNTNSVTEWNNQGAAVSSSGYTTSTLAAPGPIAIDASGNAWTCGQNGLTKLNFLGMEQPGSPFAGGGLTTSGCLNMAIDGLGNIWATNSSSVAKFDDLGVALSPSGGYTIPISPTSATTATILPPLTIDESNNVWLGFGDIPRDATTVFLGELVNSDGAPNYLNPTDSLNFVDTSSPAGQTQIAADASGDVWIPVGILGPTASLAKLPPYGGIGTLEGTSLVLNWTAGNNPYADPRGVAVDGAETVWVGNAGRSTIEPTTAANLAGFNPALPEQIFEYASSTLSNLPLSVAADGSGNLWVLLDNDTVTEYVGLGAPTATPLSVAVENKKVGAKP